MSKAPVLERGGMKIKLITMAKEVSNQGYVTKLHKITQNTGFKELLGYSWGMAAPMHLCPLLSVILFMINWKPHVSQSPVNCSGTLVKFKMWLSRTST